MFSLRDAQLSDLEQITQIYNFAVEHTTAIWNDHKADIKNRQIWFEDRQKHNYPVLVSVDDHGLVLGFASFDDWRAFDGYRHTVEHSVYVDHNHYKKGIATALVRELMARARDLQKHVMIAAIESSNHSSVKLHEKLGFEKAGTLKEVGTKFDRWLDLTFMQKFL